MSENKPIKIKVSNLNAWYAEKQVLFDISIDIYNNEIMALIGPSGCGKSTFLRQLNRMNDVIDTYSYEGSVVLDKLDIADQNVDTVQLRTRVGMVFQKPNPFPKSIYDNIAYGPLIHGLYDDKNQLNEIVVNCLKRAGLFNEVSDRLHESATSLSGGQQQRLCIARAMAINPDVILMDEPCSALDPVATAHIEELLNELKEQYTIIVVTHSMHQAARISKRTAFFNLGKLIEVNSTEKMFNDPENIQTLHYITGRYG